MEPEPVIWVAALIGFNNVRKCLRILDNISLQIPGPTNRDFPAQDQSMTSLASTDQKTANDGTSSAQGQQCRSFRSIGVGAKKLHLDTLIPQAALVHQDGNDLATAQHFETFRQGCAPGDGVVATAPAIGLSEALKSGVIERTHDNVQGCSKTQGHGWRQFPTSKMR